MADIVVSALVQQIENHIQANRAASALALCTHILYYYPKHLETYSLMAQALSQQGNLDGALDVYRRVLSADPENAGAYAGIARIFDYRHHLEEAIWHMERAFELSPGSTAVRSELLRLHSQYDMTPRERLKLTRGALARMYAHEGLYDRAIHEFREIGSTSLSRYDIRVALAETLWRAGNTRDAADVAQSLLDSLPYSLKANLILGTAWHESAIPEAQTYLERAVSLDPSNQVALKILGARSPLRVARVTVPEYIEGAPPPPRVIPEESFASQPSPSIPVEAEETLSFSATPQPPAPVPPVEPTQEPIVEQAELPPAAVAETSSEVIASESVSADTEQREPKPSILESDLPPWLRSDALPPVEPAPGQSFAAESNASGAASNPDWLVELRRTFSGEPAPSTGVPAELIPTPVLAEQEKPSESPALVVPVSVIVEQEKPVEPPASVVSVPILQSDVEKPIAAESAPVAIQPPRDSAPISETPTETQGQSVPGWLSAKSETEQPSAEPEVPAWLKEGPPTPAPSAPALPAMRVPKWVEVLSQREPEPEPQPVPRAEEKIAPAPVVPKNEFTAPPASRADTMPPARPSTLPTRLTPTPPLIGTAEPKPAPAHPEPFVPFAPIAAEPPPAPTEPPAPIAPIVAEPPPTPTEPPAPIAAGPPPAQPFVAPPIIVPSPPKIITRPEPQPPAAELPISEPVVAALPPAPPTQVPEPEPPPADISQPKIKRQPKYYSRLALAREHRNAERLQDALREYEFVITKAPRLVPEVILDLEALVATGDAPLDAHRLLGDAYTRAGRLNDALERYRFVKRAVESR